MLRMPSDDGYQGRGCNALHKLPQLCPMMHVMSISYQSSLLHEQCILRCRRLHVMGCGSASSLVSGISALLNLEHLEIDVDNSLGTIGKLRILTELRTRFLEQGAPEELRLENPKLQSLSLVGFDNYGPQVTARYNERCTSSYCLHCTFQHCLVDGGLLLAGGPHVAVLVQLDSAPRATH